MDNNGDAAMNANSCRDCWSVWMDRVGKDLQTARMVRIRVFSKCMSSYMKSIAIYFKNIAFA